jgi:uncharacterized membrane protein YidH (DUF202 family)
VTQAAQQRFVVFGALIPMFTIFAVRAAKEYGWMPSKGATMVFVVAIGVLCVAGGIIAYRTTQAQVRRDLDEVQNAVRIKR